MVIEYSDSKDVKCYSNFVINPEDRKASKAFSKTFGANLMKPAKKLHDRLTQYVSAGAYNAEYGRTDNRIEIKQGCKKNEPLIFKVRISLETRKFFNSIINSEKELLLTQDWHGDYSSIKTIYVIAVNNHDYNSI